MRVPFLTANLLGVAALYAFADPAPAEATVGEPSPNVTASAWFNHIGADFDLASLKGQAVVLEFWATW